MKKWNGVLLVCLTVSVVLGGFLYLSYLAGRTTGLYEYIRRSDRYIEKGKYPKAVDLLEKAYAELPGSENMRDHLVYGYVRYARSLVKEGKPDQAIENLLKARGIDAENQAALNDLAYLYAEKGVELSKEKDYATAVNSINTALDYAMASWKVRKNISSYLFNRAVEAFNRKDGKTLLLCLNASYALSPRAESLIMMGEYFYSELQLEKAEFWLEKALRLGPNDAGIHDKLEKVRKEIALKGKMRNIRTEHFSLQLYRDYDIDIAALKDVFSGIYDAVGRDLNYYPGSSTPIILYTEQDFRDTFKKPGIVRGFYDGSIRMIFSPKMSGEMFKVILAHEYTHAVISLITENRCPSWLHEGIAVFEQSRYKPEGTDLVKIFLDEGGSLSLSLLERGFDQADDNAFTALSYEGAYTAISFILDKWGWMGLRGLLKRIGEGAHFVNAIDEEFYISTGNFEKMWNEYANAGLNPPYTASKA